MIDEKELALVIRAQLKGGKDLDSIAKSIKDIGTAIDEQTQAAKRGDSSIDALKASLEALSLTQKELQGQSSAIKYFERLNKGLATTEARVQSATTRYNDYLKKLDEAGQRTDKQQERLLKYAAAVERSNASLANQKARIAAMSDEFAKAGIAVDKLADTQQRNATLQAELGLAFERGKDAIKGYAQAVRDARAAQAEQARAAAEAEKIEKRRLAILEQQRAQAAAEAAGIEQDYRRMIEADKRRTIEAERNAAARAEAILAERRAQAKAEAEGIMRDAAAAKRYEQAAVAERNARAYSTLARAADNLNPKVKSLRDTIAEIVNPTNQARATLNGLEQEVNSLAGNIGKLRSPVRDYKGQVDQLVASQRAIGEQAGLIDSFNRQVAALRQTREAFVQARAQVAEYSARVKLGGEDSAQFAQKLTAADAALRRAAQAYAQQASAARASRDALRAAGIDTNNLVAAQQRLTAVAQTNANAVRALDQAVERYGQAQERVRSSGGLFGSDGGRTTLSYLQRIRGEVLSLVAAYGGLFTVIRTAQGAIEASQSRESLRGQLSLSAGVDRAAIDADYEYIRQQADRIGLEFEKTAQSYAKFATAATLAGRPKDEIREIFESFAEVGQVANLTQENIDGIFKALEQSISKGKIQAEELRGQLADRLPGAFQAAQKALAGVFPDLDKALEKGQVSSEYLILIAREYRKFVAEQLGPATKSLRAEQNRLNTEIFNFQLAVADSGFINSYKNAIMDITKFLRSEDGKQFAQNIGGVFKALTDAFIVLLKNIDLLTTGFTLFLTLFTFQRFASGIAALQALIPTLIASTTAVNGLTLALGLANKAFAVFAIALAAFQISSYLYEQSEGVRTVLATIVTSFFKAWAAIKASYSATIDAFPVLAKEVFQKVVSTIAAAAKKLLGIFASLAEAVGLDGVGKALRDVANGVDASFAGFGKSAAIVKSYREELQKELAQIESIRKDMIAADGRSPDPSKPAAGQTTATGNAPGKKTGLTDAEKAKLEREMETIRNALETLEARVDRSQTDTLQAQLDAIETDTADLGRRIAKLGGETGKLFMERFNRVREELRRVTTEKFNKGLLDEQEALSKKIGDLDEQTNKKARLDLERRLKAITDNYGQVFKELDDLQAKFVANGRDTRELDGQRMKLSLAEQEAKRQETIKFNTEELNRRETQLNDTIAARDKLLQAVNAQKEVGNIDDVEAAKQLNQIQAEYVPKIREAGEATREWALANSAIFANPEQQAVFLATLDAVIARATAAQQQFSVLQNTIIQGGVNAVNQGLNLMVDALTDIATGASSAKDGFQSLIAGFGQFAASFLRDIAIMILRMQLFRALSGLGGTLGAVGAAGLKSMGVMHEGGVVGQSRNRTRAVSPAWFANAPRYHAGGLAGLAPNEYPTILKKGEEVLNESDPRNVLNGGMAPQPASAPGNFRVVLVDDRQKVPEAMNSPEGESVFMQFVTRNAPTIKQALG